MRAFVALLILTLLGAAAYAAETITASVLASTMDHHGSIERSGMLSHPTSAMVTTNPAAHDQSRKP